MLDAKLISAYAEMMLVNSDSETFAGFDAVLASAETAYRYAENKRASKRVTRRHKRWAFGPDFETEGNTRLLEYN